MHRRSAALVILLPLVTGCLAPTPPAPTEPPASAPPLTPTSAPPAWTAPAPSAGGAGPRTAGPGDAVVIAVLDNKVNPYHLDWRADLLPQHRDADPSNDLPVNEPPHTWLPGFADPAGFASYEPLPLTLARAPTDNTSALAEADATVWDAFPRSGPDAVHYRWVPGTKVIGLLGYATDGPPVRAGSHGARTSSVAAGSLFGTCPQCLLVFIDADFTEDPVRWALAQPWIDVVTNSWSSSDTATNALFLDRHFVYTSCDVDQQREAAERGLGLFWSGSNGLVPGAVPITTWQSCHFGPDWMITVGGIFPDGGNHADSGKPVDIAGPANLYPSQGAPDAEASATIGGTSAATPVTAGLFARALWEARTALEGPSRVQAQGIVAVGTPRACGDARPDCELGDGVLTARELRTRFLHAAQPTPEGWSGTAALPVVGSTPAVPLPPAPETELLAEGHGSFWGRLRGDEAWAGELARIIGPMAGTTAAPGRPDGEAAWMTVDSYCRQRIWGAWGGGYHVEGDTALPGPDPAWPLRSGYEASCPALAALLGPEG